MGSLIRQSHLPQNAKTKLLGGNAARFLKLDGEPREIAEKESSAVAGSSPIEPKSGQLTYSSYLLVPELLELQNPQSSPTHHDELLFIVVHQTYELWFKELLHDLDAVVDNLKKQARLRNRTMKFTKQRVCCAGARRSRGCW